MNKPAKYHLKMAALKKDIQLGISSAKAGRFSKVTASEIIKKAKSRTLNEVIDSLPKDRQKRIKARSNEIQSEYTNSAKKFPA